jgi:hypothetical protein
MSLTFPNRSRSYDETARRIRFSGYDGMFEVRFFIELDALAKAYAGKMSGENEFLSAFDSVRKTVLEVAERVYGKTRTKGMCTLTAHDFG